MRAAGFLQSPPVLTLHRHILAEVTRILLVSAAALVMMMAFATAIKPLTEGMLGADTLVKFVVYMCPSMLEYALPFAAAMGSTLVYMRMVQDNEILACQASGLSHKKLIAPVLLLGAGLMVLLLALSGWIAPALYRQAAQTAQGDVVHALVQKLNQGEAFKDDEAGVAIFANEAHSEEPPPGLATGNPDLQAESVVSMAGVAVGKLDKQGKLESDVTASGAKAVLYRDLNSGDALVAIRLENPRLFDGASNGGKDKNKAQMGRAKAVDRIRFVMPNPVHDKVEFLSIAELSRLLTHPEDFDSIREKRSELAKVVATERFRRSVVASLAAGVALRGPLGEETYTVSAPRSDMEQGGALGLVSSGDIPVEVTHRDAPGSVPLRKWSAQGGRITFDLDRESGEPVAMVSLKNVRVSDPRNRGVVSAKSEYAFDALAWSGAPLEGARAPSVDQWLNDPSVAAAAQADPTGPIAKARTVLVEQKKLVRRKVIAQFHERGASAVACLLLAVLGAVMSLWRRGSMPLVVYFWCFLLAVVSIIIVSTGANIAKASQERFVGGLALLWVPIFLQAGLSFWILRRLRRPGA